MKFRGRATLFLGVVLSASAVIYIWAITPNGFGYYHDDGIYVTAAKSLATGHGYRIISLPGDPVETKSPPLYPFLLSLVWRLDPAFPENLVPMMLLSVGAAMASLALSWFYLQRRGYASSWQALLVVGLVALNWRTVVLASGVYSELFYTALSVGGLYLTEEYEDRLEKWTIGLAAGVALGLAFLTRTSGISLVVAAGAYFCLRRKVRLAALPLGMATIFILGWIGWCYFHRTDNQGVNAGYYESYFQTLALVLRQAQGSGHSSVLAIISGMVAQNFLMLVPVSIPIVCMGLTSDWARSFGTEGQVLGLVLFIIVLILIVDGFFRLRTHFGALKLMQIYVVTYLTLQVLWPYSGYDRFLMPLLPFLLLFLITGFARPVNMVWGERSQGPLTNRISAVVVALVLTILVGASLSAYGYGLYGSVSRLKRTRTAQALEDLEAIQWINEHTDPSDVLVCYRDLNYYLYTGRKATFACPLVVAGLMTAQPDKLDQQAKTILQIIDENHARYLILTPIDLEEEYEAYLYRRAYKVLVGQSRDIFVAVFKSTHGSVVYRIDDSPASGLPVGQPPVTDRTTGQVR